ncbi:MAG: dockerin type I domain-containing protein, partial [Planctomycetota bacterium]
LDEFIYTTRDIEVRFFQISDIGPIGDLNLDGNVNGSDLHVVVTNVGTTGDLEVEQGDANLDGAVDTTDANIVIQSTP